MLLNIVGSAVKYNQESGTVIVAWGPVADGHVVLSIADMGPGIPEEHLACLFELDNRLDADTTQAEGTRVGLALAKRLMEAMGA